MSFERNEWKVEEDETVIVDPTARKEAAGEKHNWKATGIAVCSITLVMLAVTTAAFVLGVEDEDSFWRRVPYDLRSVLDGESSIFINRSATNDQWRTTHWIADHQLVYWDASGGLSVYRALAGETALLVPAVVVLQWRADDYWPSHDGRYVLLRQVDSDANAHLFHQREDLYAVYDVQSGDLWKVRLKPEHLHPTRFAYVRWAGSTSHLLAVSDNKIYSTRDATSRTGWDLLDSTQQFKSEDSLSIGLPDWTYSEGIMKMKTMMWPSMDGEWLVYARLNSTRCQKLDFIDYATGDSRAKSIRHAVPGGQLPEIELRLVRLESDAETPLAISQLANDREWLLFQVEWLDRSSFVTVWMSRSQNQTWIHQCRVSDAQCHEILLEEASANRWLRPPGLYSTGNGFTLVLLTDELTGGQRLIYLRPPRYKAVSIDVSQLAVHKVVGWDETSKLTYLLASPSDEPQLRHLYRSNQSDIECLTCSLDADNCQFVDVNFEPTTAAFYELKCLGPHIPSVHVVRSDANEVVTTLQRVADEGNLRELLEHLTPEVRYLSIPLADGSVGRAQLLTPRSWNDGIHHKLRYPLIIQPLDWDEDDALTDQWRKDWAGYFTLTRQVIYARIYGRERRNEYGTLKLGVRDLLSIAHTLVREVSHVQDDAVFLIGKGVGGYLASMMMAHDEEDLFKCAAVISPVIDFMQYETTIAERFLGGSTSHQENFILSRTDSIIHKIKNDTILVMDSYPFNPVQHYQTTKLSQKLINAGTRFQHKVYHQANKELVMYHLYLSLEHFITHCV